MSLNQERSIKNQNLAEVGDGRDLAEVIVKAKAMIAHAADVGISQANLQIIVN